MAQIHDFERSDLPAATKTALRFTERWVRDHAQTIDDALFEELREHFSDEQIYELTLIVGYYDMSHRMNNALGIERPNQELYDTPAPRVPSRLAPYLDELKARRAEREQPPS